MGGLNLARRGSSMTVSPLIEHAIFYFSKALAAKTIAQTVARRRC
jgi:hypothetical protein